MILMSAMYSCNKDKTEPISSFTINGNDNNTFKVASFDDFSVVSNSTNTDSVLWDLGDGRTIKEHEFVLSYPKSGTYTLKLIAKNNNGNQTETSKEIIVVDRVLKRIEIESVYWDTTNTTEGWPQTNSNVDIYFQIQKFTDNTMEPVGIYPKCPVLYTSSVEKNISNNTIRVDNPIVFNVNEKIIINRNLVQHPRYLINAYLFSVMAKDKNNQIYCLISSDFIGTPMGFMIDDISKNTFTIIGGYGTSFKLVGTFE